MAMYIGNRGGSKVVALGTNDAELFNNPAPSSVVFRSDLPYIYTSTYTSTSYSDIADRVFGNIRRFSLPNQVILAQNFENKVVLFYFRDSEGRKYPAGSILNYFGYVTNDWNWGWGDSHRNCFASVGCTSRSIGTAVADPTGPSKGNPGGLIPVSIPFSPFPTPDESSIGTSLAGIVALDCVVLESLKHIGDSVVWSNSELIGSGDPEVLIDRTGVFVNGRDIAKLGLLARASGVYADKESGVVGIPAAFSDVLLGMPSVPEGSMRAAASGLTHFSGPYTNVPTSSFSLGSNPSGTLGFRAKGGFSGAASGTGAVAPVFGTLGGIGRSGLVLDSRTPAISLGGQPVYSPEASLLYLIGPTINISLPETVYVRRISGGTNASVLVETREIRRLPSAVLGRGFGLLSLYGQGAFKILPGTSPTVYDPVEVSVPASGSGLSCSLFDLNTGDIPLVVGSSGKSSNDKFGNYGTDGYSYIVYLRREGDTLIFLAKIQPLGDSRFTFTQDVRVVVPSISLGLSFFA